MANNIWIGLEAGVVMYDLTYDAYRPDPYGTQVNITFHLHCYLKSGSNFGYTIRWDAMWCNGTNWYSGVVKDTSQRYNWDIYKDCTATVYTSNDWIGGVRLIMTSPDNSGSSGKYDTGADINIWVPAMSVRVEPTAPNYSVSPTRIKVTDNFTVSWSGHSGGSYSIEHFCVDARKYTATTETWSDWSNTYNWNNSYPNTYSSNTTSATFNGRGLFSDLMPNDQIQFNVTMRASNGTYYMTNNYVTVTAYKDGKLMYKDNNGTWHECTQIRMKDIGGTTRTCSVLRVKDTNGTIRTVEMP